MSDSFTNYNYVRNTKKSVSIKKTYANKCTLCDIVYTHGLTDLCIFALRIMGSHYFQASFTISTATIDDKKRMWN